MTDATSTAPGEYSHQQILTILTGLMSGMLLAALDQTIVGTAIRTIADDLSGLSIQAWVTTAYLVTSTIATPIYGKLGDLFGRKSLFSFAITIFVIGSVLCTFSTSMYELAAFRAVQGIGAGGLFTLAIAILGDIVAPRERAKYTGYMMAVFATSSVVGPIIGGLFAEADTIFGIAGWRWIFLINAPIGAIALVVVSRTLHLHHVRREARIDWWGAVLLVVALVPLLTVAEQGRSWGWGSGRSLACFVVGALGVLGFVYAEHRMGRDALIPLAIFRIRAAAVTIIGSVVVGVAMFGGMTVLPQYMQIVHGASPMTSGLMMLPLVLGMMSASMGSGIIVSRTGRVREFPIIGTALMSLGLFLLATIDADSPLWLVMVYMLVTGLGLGNCMQPLMLIVQNAVPPQAIGVATSSATFFRQIGGTVGVAVFLSVLFSTVGDNIRSAFGAAAKTPQFQSALTDPAILQNPDNAAVAHAMTGGSTGVLQGVQDDSSIINRLADVFAHPFKVGFAQSMDVVFLAAGCVGVVGLLVLLCMPKVTLRTQSASAAARAAAMEA